MYVLRKYKLKGGKSWKKRNYLLKRTSTILVWSSTIILSLLIKPWIFILFFEYVMYVPTSLSLSTVSNAMNRTLPQWYSSALLNGLSIWKKYTIRASFTSCLNYAKLSSSLHYSSPFSRFQTEGLTTICLVFAGSDRWIILIIDECSHCHRSSSHSSLQKR